MAAHASLSESLQTSLTIQRSISHVHDPTDHLLVTPRIRSQSGHNSEYSGTDASRRDKEQEEVSCKNRVALAAVAYGPEAMVSFEAIYGILSLQYLGVPVYLVSLNGIICGFISFFLIPAMGSFADRGPNTKKRRMLSLLLGLSSFVLGFSLVACASGLKAYSLKHLSEPFDSSKINSSGANAFYPGSETPERLNGSIFPFINEDNKTIISINNASNPSSPTTGIPTTAILGIAGFTILDIGFDSSMSQVRTFLVDSVPEHQNGQIIAVSTVLAAVGGIVNTVLGMFDLPAILGPMLDMDGVSANLIVMSVGFIVLVVLTFIASVTTAVRITARKTQLSEERQNLLPKTKHAHRTSAIFDVSPDGHEAVGGHLVSSGRSVKSTHSKTFPSGESPKGQGHTPKARQTTTFLTQWAFVLNTRLILVYIAAFLTFGNLSAVTVYFSNIVTKEVLRGDPSALSGTEAYSLYKQGLRVSSAGMLLSYLAYFASSVVNGKLMDLVGAKLLFLLANAMMSAVLTLYCVVQTTGAYYASMAVYGLYRCSAYSHPFLLATTFATRNKSAQGVMKGRNKEDNLAKVISLLGFLFTLHYLLLSFIIAPWMDAVSSAWPAAYYVIASGVTSVVPLGILLFL